MKSYILYISVFLISLILTVVIEARLIPFLKKRAQQPIYEGGPSWHMSKSGTPTMGGIAFLIAISVSLLIASLVSYIQGKSSDSISLLITLLFAVGNSLIGICDDLKKLRKKENAGLTPMQKIGLQTILAVLFLMAREYFFSDGTKLKIFSYDIDLGVFYYLFAIILLLGIVNCANLTDGIDGLASSIAVTIGFSFFIIAFQTSTVTTLSSALVGGAIGFLFFNSHPARIFMGDTGSLFLGALAVGIAFSIRNPLLIILIGIVYVIEGASVILQVTFYKATKKRLFKMAPLHHHLERCGLNENKICLVAVLTTLVFSAISFLLLRG